MQKSHREVGHLFVVVFKFEPAGPAEAADHRGFDPFGPAELGKRVPIGGRHGQDHSFLGFGNPNLGIRQAGVFERGPVEPDFGSRFLAHLADGAGESAGPAVGDGVNRAPGRAPCSKHVEQHFFGDGVADLHGAARQRFALAGQFGRGKRRAVNAVAAGAAADGHDQIAGLHSFFGLVGRDQADVAAVDQRIAQIAAVEDRPLR